MCLGLNKRSPNVASRIELGRLSLNLQITMNIFKFWIHLENQPEDMQNWTNLYLEAHDYRIHYVNIDLRHQYGISVAESQTFLLVKRPQRRRA